MNLIFNISQSEADSLEKDWQKSNDLWDALELLKDEFPRVFEKDERFVHVYDYLKREIESNIYNVSKLKTISQ